MRLAFFNRLEELSRHNDKIIILTADLGFKLFDNIKKSFKERFIDVGVAEANMIGLAAGLSLSGKTVYCYSIIPFLIMRAFEQIRIDIAFHNLNVKLVGVGGGFTYGLEGFTHFGLEDFALMRALPNMTVVVPADPWEAEKLAELSLDYEKPMYIRLGRSGDPVINTNRQDMRIGKALFLEEGSDVALVAVGSMVLQALEVSKRLALKGIKSTVVNMHTLKPVDYKSIEHIASHYNAVFTLEEHYISGGLGTIFAEFFSENGYQGKFRRFGIVGLKNVCGKADFLRKKNGLDADSITEGILVALK